MMSKNHYETVQNLTRDITGIEEVELVPEEELLHLHGTFDRLILKNTLEKAGFFVYLEKDIPCKFKLNPPPEVQENRPSESDEHSILD